MQVIKTVGELRRYLEVFGDDVKFGSSYDGREARVSVSMMADCEDEDFKNHSMCEYDDVLTVFVVESSTYTDPETKARIWEEGHEAGWQSRHEDWTAGWTPSTSSESDAVNPYRS